MQNGKINNLERTYAKKKIFYLLLVWGTFLVCVSIVLILYFSKVNDLVISIVIFFLFVFMFIVLFYCKTKISFYDLRQRYQLLLDQSKGPEKTNCQFDNQWLDSLQKHGYQSYVNDTNYAIFYLIKKSLSKKSFVRTNFIEIISIIRNKSLDFYATEIENVFKSLWIDLEKKHKLNKQVIIHFKKFDSFDEKVKNDLDRIISYKEGDNYLININCGFFPGEKSLYYLHSDKYYPNIYYKHAVETIKEIVTY